MTRPRHSPVKLLETWLWTGPVGHFAGGALDFAGALARYLLARARAANDSLGASARPALPKDSDTPRGMTSTGQVAISIRCDSRGADRDAAGRRRPCASRSPAGRCCSSATGTTSRAERPGQGLRRRLGAAVATGLADRDDPLHARLTAIGLGQSRRSDRDRDRTALEQLLGGVADRDVARERCGSPSRTRPPERRSARPARSGLAESSGRSRRGSRRTCRRTARRRGRAPPGPPRCSRPRRCGERSRGTPRRRRGRAASHSAIASASLAVPS